MKQIAGRLKKLGMSEYADRVAENRIDFAVLQELTDQDLKDLGVVLGDRLQNAARDPEARRRFGYRHGIFDARGDRPNSARRRRASSADGDVH
jgi:hypothetical protein